MVIGSGEQNEEKVLQDRSAQTRGQLKQRVPQDKSK